MTGRSVSPHTTDQALAEKKIKRKKAEKEERTCMYCWRPICCCDSCMSDGSWGETAVGCIIDGGMWCAGCCW